MENNNMQHLNIKNIPNILGIFEAGYAKKLPADIKKIVIAMVLNEHKYINELISDINSSVYYNSNIKLIELAQNNYDLWKSFWLKYISKKFPKNMSELNISNFKYLFIEIFKLYEMPPKIIDNNTKSDIFLNTCKTKNINQFIIENVNDYEIIIKNAKCIIKIDKILIPAPGFISASSIPKNTIRNYDLDNIEDIIKSGLVYLPKYMKTANFLISLLSDIDLFKLFLKYNFMAHNYNGIMNEALELNRYDIIDIILKNNADMSNILLKKTSVEMLQVLLKHGFDINNLCGYHKSLLCYNIDNYYVIEYAINNGANTFIGDENGNTPLHLAIMNGNIGIIKILINSLINPQAKNKYGMLVTDVIHSLCCEHLDPSVRSEIKDLLSIAMPIIESRYAEWLLSKSKANLKRIYTKKTTKIPNKTTKKINNNKKDNKKDNKSADKNVDKNIIIGNKCQYITSRGSICKNYAIKDSIYCHIKSHK